MAKSFLKIISYVGLLLTLVPAFLVFFQKIDLSTNKYLMLLGTVLWFGSAPLWMNKSKSAE
jgi:hypothetical protein